MTYDPFDPFNEVPMYTDYFLKFDTEAEANAVLFDFNEIVDRDEQLLTIKTPRYAAVDVVGVIYKPTGKMLPAEDGSGDAVDEMAPLEGWHVNVRHTAEAPELDAYKVEVKTPARMWA